MVREIISPEPETIPKPVQALPTPTAVVQPQPEPVPKRRGRPRKHKNNAVKQAEYRRRKQDPERRALVDAIVWRTPMGPSQRIATIEGELLKLSIRKLREKLRKFRNDSPSVSRASKYT